MKRRQLLKQGSTALASAALGACGAGSGHDLADARPGGASVPLRPTTGQPNALSLSVDAQAKGVAVNRLLLGQNLQWVDRADAMFDGTAQIRPTMLALAQRMGVTTLRYPGGLQSDTYHWARGMGLLIERGLNEHANARTMQPTLVGTQAFLELCEALGAERCITVNLASGTAAEAAAWVKQVNVDGLISSRTGKRLPRVPLWELGNEPYLKPDEQPTLWMSPEVFSTRARAFAKAMLAVDASIQLSLPLSVDKRNGFPVTPYPGFASEVLRTPINGVSLVSLHNAYVPFGMDRAYTLDELYWGAMAGGRSVSADLQATRSLLARCQPGLRPRFAITEHNALFTLGKGDTDQLPLAPVGALAVADVLQSLAAEADVALAHFWSMSGNGFFGAIHQDGWLRPVGQVLALFSEALQGQRLPAQLRAPTVSTPSVGACPPVAALPVAEVMATREGRRLRLLVIHKDPSNPAVLTLALGQSRVASAQLSVLACANVFDTRDSAAVMTRSDSTWSGTGPLSLPPHSVALLTLTLQGAA